MQVAFIFVSSLKLKFKTYFRFECRDIEIPLFHLAFVRNGFPDFFNGSIESSFNYKWFVFHFFLLFFLDFLNGLRLLAAGVSLLRKFSRASNLLVHKTRYCSIQRDT